MNIILDIAGSLIARWL